MICKSHSMAATFTSTLRMYDFEMQYVNKSNGFSVASYQGGPFLAELFAMFNMIATSSMPSAPVFSIHATHDTTIKPILNFFGQVPPPAVFVASPSAPTPLLCDACVRFRTPTTPTASLDGLLIVPCSCSSCKRAVAAITLSALCTMASKLRCLCSLLPALP